MSLLASILACLLALLAASPACCGPAVAVEVACCCCSGGDSPDEPADGHRCPCVADDPADAPEPAVLPPPGGGGAAVPAPAATTVAVPWFHPGNDVRPRWTPARPWHAPPSERRARLVLRTL
jgi:hypothetical protein